MSRLLIIEGPNVGVKYEIGDRVRIGRLGENEIQVPDPNVSRIHAEIVNDRGKFVISDRGSKNGIIINGEAVPEKTLAPGDKIVIGGATFLFDGDLEIRNVRYSNNSVYYVAAEKGIDKADNVISLDSVDKSDRKALENLLAVTSIFAGAPRTYPEVTRHICERIQEHFVANHAALFLRGRQQDELLPIEAAPHDVALSIDHSIIRHVDEKKTAVALVDTLKNSTNGRSTDTKRTFTKADTMEFHDSGTPPAKKSAKSKETSSAQAPVATMCAPLMDGDNVQGLLMVLRSGSKAFTATDLLTLQAMADLASVVVPGARASSCLQIKVTPVLDLEERTPNTRSLRMQEIFNSAKRSADGDGAILITGESGTGKETLARYIHENGERSGGPFVTVNCATIPTESFEGEFFGYQGLTDNGDARIKPGLIEQAMGGTLFLREIEELDLTLQPKLLRFLQDRAFYRSGSTNPVEADIRIVTATSVDLAAVVRAGRFREDLWYRLNVIPFHMPPLRERREDIAPLVDFFISLHATRLNHKVIGANDSAISLLQKYDWPGNVRELDNAVQRAIMLAESKVLSTADFSFIEDARRKLNSQADLERKRDTKPLSEVERQHIIIALKKHNYNQARAAEALGLHRNTLRNKIIEYGIEIPK